MTIDTTADLAADFVPDPIDVIAEAVRVELEEQARHERFVYLDEPRRAVCTTVYYPADVEDIDEWRRALCSELMSDRERWKRAGLDASDLITRRIKDELGDHCSFFVEVMVL